MGHNKYTSHYLFDEKLIFFKTKDSKILLFQVKHYTIKTYIIRYHLLTNSAELKHCNQKWNGIST